MAGHWDALGTVFTRAIDLEPGLHEFNGHRIIKDNKMVVIRAPSAHGAFDIHVFPYPEHWFEFHLGEFYLDNYNRPPGAVGTIRVKLDEENNRLELTQVQAGFKVGRLNPSKELVKRYMGWRHRALQEAIKLAAEHEKALFIPKKLFYVARSVDGPQESEGPNALEPDLRKACKNVGAQLTLDIEGNALVRLKKK